MVIYKNHFCIENINIIYKKLIKYNDIQIIIIIYINKKINVILFQNKEINDLIFMLCTFENSFFMNFIIKKMLHFAYYFLKISGT